MARARKPGSGGPRQGTPGQSYTNRSDLNANKQPIQTVPGQTYGVATAQRQAQQTIPMAGNPVSAAPPPLAAPTARPAEPITAGMAMGAGPGPEAAAVPLPGPDPTVNLLKGMLQRYPNADLQAILAQALTKPT